MLKLRLPGFFACLLLSTLTIPPAAVAEDVVLRLKKEQWLELKRECQAGKQSGICDLLPQPKRPNTTAGAVAASTAANAATANALAAPMLTKATSTAPKPIPPLLNVTTSSLCRSNAQGLFVRADPLDNFNYAVSPVDPKAAVAKGLDIGYTNNHIAGTQTVTANGRGSYLLFGELCDAGGPTSLFLRGLGVATFASSNGTWNEPLVKTSNSALKGGADFDVALATPFFPIREHYLYFSPYYQTDFRGLSHANGATFGWEPVSPDLFLDVGRPFSAELAPYFLFFWQFRPEVDLVEVTNTGLTNLTKGDHTWIGANVRANLALFPLNPYIRWPEWIGGRFSLIGTVQDFRDVKTSTTANYYSLVVQYKLGNCKRGQADSKDVNPCAIQGSSALSFEYDWGTNKDTLVNTNQYLAKLSFAY